MVATLTRRLFTVDEYQRMGEVGILTEDDRVELIEGDIVAMSPIGPSHSWCVNRLTQLMVVLVIGRGAVVSVQNPIRLVGSPSRNLTWSWFALEPINGRPRDPPMCYWCSRSPTARSPMTAG